MPVSRSLAGFVLLAFSAFSLSAQAQTVGVTFSGEQVRRTGSFNLGWEFTANDSFVVTALGMYDADQDGLSGSHFVGLYNASTQALLASTSVSSANPLFAKFRYADIAPVALSTGQNYVVAAINGDDSYALNPTTTTFGTGITFVRDHFGSDTHAFPASTSGINGWYGANLRYSAASNSVPEPATAALLGLAFGVLALRRRARRGV